MLSAHQPCAKDGKSSPVSLHVLYQSWKATMDYSHPASKYLRKFDAVDQCRLNGYGAASANQAASVQRPGQIAGYSSLSPQGQQAIAAQGATVDLSDAIDASNLQTVGTIRANATQREADISQLEAASHSIDPAQHTEMATLQRINQALLIRTAHTAGDQPDPSGPGAAADGRAESTSGQPEIALPNRQ